MKKWIIAFVIILSGVIFLFWGADSQNLGGNYYYLPKYEAIDIGYPGGGIIYKSTQKNIFRDIKIHGNVINIGNNTDFIIAIQNTDTSYIEKAHSNFVEKDSLKYFIIVKKTDLIYGPYNNKDYIQKREELGVPDKLELEK